MRVAPRRRFFRFFAQQKKEDLAQLRLAVDQLKFGGCERGTRGRPFFLVLSSLEPADGAMEQVAEIPTTALQKSCAKNNKNGGREQGVLGKFMYIV